MAAPETSETLWSDRAIRRTTTTTAALLVGVYIIDYVDRTFISVALPFIGEDLGLDKTQQGWVVSVFAIAYMLFQIPGGRLADRFGPRPLLLSSLVLWSAFTALTGLVWGLVALLVFRVMFGFSQALFPGASFKALAERTPPRRRGTFSGVMLSSNIVGAALGPILAAPLIAAIGWRHTFWVIAVAGAAIGLTIAVFLPKPLPTELTNEEAAPDPGDKQGMGLGAILRIRGVWLFAALFCAVNMLNYGMITWVPSYLLDVRGIALTSIGALAAIPLAVQAVSVFLGGYLFDRYFTERARWYVVPLLFIAAVMLVLMLQAESTTEFVVYQALAMGVAGFSLMGVVGMPIRALPTPVVATGMSVVNVGGQLAGVLAPVVMGALVDAFSYTAAFGYLVATTAAAALIALIVPQNARAFHGTKH